MLGLMRICFTTDKRSVRVGSARFCFSGNYMSPHIRRVSVCDIHSHTFSPNGSPKSLYHHTCVKKHVIYFCCKLPSLCMLGKIQADKILKCFS